jgi:flagellar assembly protein FliH
MDQSFSAQPFCFDKIFAVAPPGGLEGSGDDMLDAAALRAELRTLRAEFDDAVDKAHARGLAEGQERARAERDQALLAAVDALHAAFDEWDGERQAMTDQLRTEASGLALAIGQTLAARALDASPVEAIDQAIGRVLTQIARGQEVIITVHPDIVSDVEARIAVRQSQDRRRLALLVEGNPALMIGDADLRWDGGGQRLSAQDRLDAIRAELGDPAAESVSI